MMTGKSDLRGVAVQLWLASVGMAFTVFLTPQLQAQVEEAQMEDSAFVVKSNGVRAEFKDIEKSFTKGKKKVTEWRKVMTITDPTLPDQKLLIFEFTDYRIVESVFFWTPRPTKKSFVVLVTAYGNHRGAIYVFDLSKKSNALVFSQDSAQPIGVAWVDGDKTLAVDYVDEEGESDEGHEVAHQAKFTPRP